MTRSVINDEMKNAVIRQRYFSFPSTYVSIILQSAFTWPALRRNAFMIFTENIYEKRNENTNANGKGDERRDEEYCLYIAKRAKIARNVARFR